MVAKRLYGRVPSAISLTMTVASSEVGMGLSHEIQSRLPDLLERAKASSPSGGSMPPPITIETVVRPVPRPLYSRTELS